MRTDKKEKCDHEFEIRGGDDQPRVFNQEKFEQLIKSEVQQKLW